MIQLYRHWARIAAASVPDMYVRKILVNVVLEDRRRLWSRRVRPVADPPEPASTSLHGGVDARLDLRVALARLTPRQRAVLVLRYWEGHGVAETAELLGCSAGTVKSQSSDAIAALRRIVPDHVSDTRDAR